MNHPNEPSARRRRLDLRLDDLVLHGVTNKPCDRMDVEFSHEISTVGFGGLNADIKDRSHFLGGPSFGNQLNHLSLSGG